MRIIITESQLESLLEVSEEINKDGVKLGQKNKFFSSPSTSKVWVDVRNFILNEMIGITNDTTYLFVKNQLLRYLNNKSTHSMIDEKVIPYFRDKLGYSYPSNDLKEYQKTLGTTLYVNYDNVKGDFVDGLMGASTLLSSIPLIIEIINRVMKGRSRDFTYGMMKKEVEKNKELERRGIMTKERQKGEKKEVDTPNQPKQQKIGAGSQS